VPEWIPQSFAVLLAGLCAVTDLLRGKVYNKVLGVGLAAAVLWLAAFAGWHAWGGETTLRSFPELGTWWWEDPPAAPQPAAGGAAPSPFAERQQLSVAGLDQGAAESPPEPAPPPFEPSLGAWAARVGVNALLAFAIGFALWWFGLWAAGDAKLFPVLALLLPLATYQEAYWPVFPSYVLLFNTFLAVIVLLLVELGIRGTRQAFRPTDEEAEAWRNAGDWVRSHLLDLAVGFVGILFLFLVIKTLRMLGSHLLSDNTPVHSRTAIYFLLFLVFFPLSRAMRHKWVLLPVSLGTVAFIVYAALYPTPDYNLHTILSVTAWSLGVILFMVTYQLYLNVFDFKPIGVWELKPRMILARRTLEVLKEDNDLLQSKMGPVGPDGLSPVQAEVLRRWWMDRGKGGRIWISRTIPFAPALFLGALATVLLGGYLLRV
jgi:Flp pilus assembly protein protease CpaA